MPVMGFCCSRSGGDTFNSHAICIKDAAESFHSPHSLPVSLLSFEIETLTGDVKQVKSINSASHIYSAVKAAFKGRYHQFTLFCQGREVTESWKAQSTEQRIVLTLVPVPS